MNAFEATLEIMVNSFTDAEELMNFAATMGIQDYPVVRFRLFQLHNREYGNEFVTEELDDILMHLGGPMNGSVTNAQTDADLELAMEFISREEEKEGATGVGLHLGGPMNGSVTHDQTDADLELAMEFISREEEKEGATGVGECNPPRLQIGGGEEPHAGPSGLKYTMRKKGERTYAKNAAVDRTYKVKIDAEYSGQKLQNVRQGLHQMFEDVLVQARDNLAGNDLGRVVIHHDGLQDPIVVPLQRWDQLNADRVMTVIEKVLDSNKDLSIDESFEISVGSIEMPKGGARRRIISIKGEDNSLHLKSSVVTITNDDQLCMARAIGVSWAKLKKCSQEEWKEITKTRNKKSNLELILENQRVPDNFFKKIRSKTRDEQRQLAVAISLLAGVPMNRPASLNDVEAFEKVLGVRVMVVSARLGNKFITSASNDQRPCIYTYLVDDDHFHAITNITGFFSARYFCNKCLKHFNNREGHQCDTYCIVCKKGECPKKDNVITCQNCNMECRSTECFDRHREQPSGLNRQRDDDQSKQLSQCETWWKCPTCYKVINRTKREEKDHRCGEYLCSSCHTYVLDDHLCFLRATPYKNTASKFIFFDFECSQDQRQECGEGYKPTICEHTSKDQCKSCVKCQNCKTSWCGKATHRPNFVVAQSACDECKEGSLDVPCKNCGSRCANCKQRNEDEDGVQCLPGCGQREVIFEGDDTLNDFGQWLFSPQHSYYEVVAHNMKGYDGYFLLEYLIDQSLRPDKIVYSGSKIMFMTVGKGLQMTVIDSLNFLPMKLSDLPETFGLTELKKGWFPHYFNTRENQRYKGPYPHPKYYGVDFMDTKDRNNFLIWYDEMKSEEFDFRSEMETYCRSDVDILRRSCLLFRDLMKNATSSTAFMKIKKDKQTVMEMCPVSIDPFNFATIASVCMGVYKTKFLKEEWKVKLNDDEEWIPARYVDGNLEIFKDNEWIKEGELGEDKIRRKRFIKTPIAKVQPLTKDQFSKESIQWLEWMAKQQGLSIQHAMNVGEKTLPGTRYKLDGYCEENNTAYEFHGCVFHGCPACFPDQDTVHPLTKQSIKELYAVTQKKRKYIEGLGMKYVCVWEHEFRDQLLNDERLRTFVNTLDITERLDPRESFFGGRTNASQLYYKTKKKEAIKYVDFTSLYPWVNKYCRYPVGHPTIITKDFGDIKDYFGIAKVKVLPPRKLYHPVLPYRSNGKLKFSLCRTCADTENQNPCTCSNEEREITGTWCSPEIETAVRLGYRITKIYEVYHWNETTVYDPTTRDGGLFSNYINTFLKFKQEASGFPDWIDSIDDKNEYVAQYLQKEGVSMDRANIKTNPGLRALAKLCLNSFWGKFGQRLNMKQTNFFHEGEANEFFKVFTDPMKQPMDFHILSNDMIQIEWQYRTHCQPGDNKTNIYLATFTTCWARLKLYSVLEQLKRRVLYYDTDSVIYVSRPGKYDPPLGDYLGELTDELKSGQHIVEFVSAGPKNYAYKTNKNNVKCKVRGFSLNYKNSQLINFDSVKGIVISQSKNRSRNVNYRKLCYRKLYYRKLTNRKLTRKTCRQSCVKEKITVTNPRKICRDKRKRKLYNREENKDYQMVYTKRRRIGGFDTVPYGF